MCYYFCVCVVCDWILDLYFAMIDLVLVVCFWFCFGFWFYSVVLWVFVGLFFALNDLMLDWCYWFTVLVCCLHCGVCLVDGVFTCLVDYFVCDLFYNDLFTSFVCVEICIWWLRVYVFIIGGCCFVCRIYFMSWILGFWFLGLIVFVVLIFGLLVVVFCVDLFELCLGFPILVFVVWFGVFKLCCFKFVDCLLWCFCGFPIDL